MPQMWYLSPPETLSFRAEPGQKQKLNIFRDEHEIPTQPYIWNVYVVAKFEVWNRGKIVDNVHIEFDIIVTHPHDNLIFFQNVKVIIKDDLKSLRTAVIDARWQIEKKGHLKFFSIDSLEIEAFRRRWILEIEVVITNLIDEQRKSFFIISSSWTWLVIFHIYKKYRTNIIRLLEN